MGGCRERRISEEGTVETAGLQDKWKGGKKLKQTELTAGERHGNSPGE